MNTAHCYALFWQRPDTHFLKHNDAQFTAEKPQHSLFYLGVKAAAPLPAESGLTKSRGANHD